MMSRYSNRFKKLGRDVKTLGWGNVEQQEFRFQQTLEQSIDFNGKKILDIGCGFGDYYTFLSSNNVNIKHYFGCDLNPDFIFSAMEENIGDKKSDFEVRNILTEKLEKPIADIGVMLGVLNLNLKNQVDNYLYSKEAITNAFSFVNECLVVDFLSTKLASEYPKEDFVFYHDPIKMLEFAFTLSSNVVLKHDYASIPQKEFMLAIYK